MAPRVTPRGLSTRTLPYGSRSFSIHFDFIDHTLAVRASDGDTRTFPLVPQTVADFYRVLMATLTDIGRHRHHAAERPRRRVSGVASGQDMAGWDHGGSFSVDASVGIAADGRPALERMLRYCARPCWASERLTKADDSERLIYTFDKPRPDGSWQLTLTSLELLDRLARFIPPPRRHLHRYTAYLHRTPLCARRWRRKRGRRLQGRLR